MKKKEQENEIKLIEKSIIAIVKMLREICCPSNNYTTLFKLVRHCNIN